MKRWILKTMTRGVYLIDHIDGWISGRVKGHFGRQYINRYSKRVHFVMSRVFPVLGEDTPGVTIVEAQKVTIIKRELTWLLLFFLSFKGGSK